MLTLVTGGVGTGKTLLAVAAASRAAGRGVKVVSNFEIRLPGCELLDLEKLLRGQYSDCLLILDEAYAYLESRLSGRAVNRALSYVLFQSRKKDLHFFLTAQVLGTVDVRFRVMADVLVLAVPNRAGFLYWIADSRTGRRRRFFLPLEAARRFFPLYDTLEVVEPIGVDDVVDEIFAGPDDVLQTADSSVPACRSWLESQGLPVTRETAELACRACGVPRRSWRVVYLRLKADSKKK